METMTKTEARYVVYPKYGTHCTERKYMWYRIGPASEPGTYGYTARVSPEPGQGHEAAVRDLRSWHGYNGGEIRWDVASTRLALAAMRAHADEIQRAGASSHAESLWALAAEIEAAALA